MECNRRIVSESKIIIDRPKGAVHPKFSDFIYRVDYGYLDNTSSMDGYGIDVWVGTDERKQFLYKQQRIQSFPQ